MMNMKYRLKVRSLWSATTAGGLEAIGALLTDGTPVILCSFRRWKDLYAGGPLGEGWHEGIRSWGGNGRVVEVDRPEETFRRFGLGHSSLELTVPRRLVKNTHE